MANAMILLAAAGLGGVTAAGATALVVLAQSSDPSPFDCGLWSHGPGGLSLGPGGVVLTLLMFFMVVVGVVLLTRKLPETPPRDSSSDRALAILKERFAAGQITGEEFDTTKARLLG